MSGVAGLWRRDYRRPSCAVVGSSGVLRGSGLGADIDAHDIVIRFNIAITGGDAAPDVGWRTTVRTFYPEASGLLHPHVQLNETGQDAARVREGLWLFIPFKPSDVAWLEELVEGDRDAEGRDADGVPAPPPDVLGMRPDAWRRDAGAKLGVATAANEASGVRARDVAIMSPRFIDYVRTRWTEGVRPTSGLLGIVMALHWCDDVSVFGFNMRDAASRYYYFKTDPPLTTEDIVNNYSRGTHDWSVEQSVRWALGDMGIVFDHTREAFPSQPETEESIEALRRLSGVW